MDIEEARRRLAENPPQGDPTAESGETLAEKAARLDADLAVLPVLDLADFRQWLIDNGGAMRLALDAADLTDAEVEARLAAAHAAAERYDAERARVAAEFGVRPDQITLRGCGGERGEEWG